MADRKAWTQRDAQPRGPWARREGGRVFQGHPSCFPTLQGAPPPISQRGAEPAQIRPGEASLAVPGAAPPSSVLLLPSLSLRCWPLRLPACVGAQPRASLLPFLGGKAAGSVSAGLRPRAVPRDPSGPALEALQCLQPPLCLWEES